MVQRLQQNGAQFGLTALNANLKKTKTYCHYVIFSVILHVASEGLLPEFKSLKCFGSEMTTYTINDLI